MKWRKMFINLKVNGEKPMMTFSLAFEGNLVCCLQIEINLHFMNKYGWKEVIGYRTRGKTFLS